MLGTFISHHIKAIFKVMHMSYYKEQKYFWTKNMPIVRFDS